MTLPALPATVIPSWALAALTDPTAPPMVRYLAGHGPPVVIKADGLCEGKGVYVCHTWDAMTYALTIGLPLLHDRR